MIEKPETIAPGECFYSPDCGMNHYYQQRDTFVLHINLDGALINALQGNFLRGYPDDSPRKWYPITEQQFMDVVQQVLQFWQLPIHLQVPISSN